LIEYILLIVAWTHFAARVSSLVNTPSVGADLRAQRSESINTHTKNQNQKQQKSKMLCLNKKGVRGRGGALLNNPFWDGTFGSKQAVASKQSVLLVLPRKLQK